MKILQVNKFFHLNGGSERYFFDVSAALEQAGHEVVHFSMTHPKNVPSPYAEYFVDQIEFGEGKRTLRKAAHFLYSTEAEKKITALVRATRPDVAHLHNIAHQLTPSIIRALKREGVPVVQTLHDYQLICPNYLLFTKGSPCERCHKQKYWQAIVNNCVQDSKVASALSAAEMTLHNVLLKSYEQGVQQFIAPSRFLHDTLVRWGWDKKQVTYLPHFVEKHRAANTKKKNQVLFIGRLTKEKGVHVLVEAARGLKNVDVLFAGTGPEESALQQIIEQEKLTHCRLLGFQDTAALDQLIQESRAVVVPSIWFENAPMVVYESLALGTPVIASNRGGLPELIQEGKNGVLFEPGDAKTLATAIHSILSQHPLQIAKNQYNKEFHLNHLEQLYEASFSPKNVQ